MRNMPLRSVGEDLGSPIDSDGVILGYQIDSRRIGEGDLFFALKGERVDGHDFLAGVAQKGAIGAVVHRDYSGDDFGLFLLRVDDVLASLQKLARLHLERSPSFVIGITGSVGKTTTKDFAATLLEKKFKVGKTFENYNTNLSLPISILNQLGDEEVLILEMGMGKPGDLRELIQIAPPHLAVLTQVALAHAAAFPGGVQQIAQEKGAIFESPRLQGAIHFAELREYPDVLGMIRGAKHSFSLNDLSADYFMSLVEGRQTIDERGVRVYRFDPLFKEKHLLHNLLAAITIARFMKMEWSEINEQINALQVPKMRFEKFEEKGALFINDAYNANPESMKAALANLPSPKEGGKRIGVLGTMATLGSFSQEAHAEIGRFAQDRLDYLLTLGEETQPLYDAFQEVKKPAEFFTDSEALAKRLAELICPGDVVLVKGSRVMKMETIFAKL
jgi:UDP-N-acetylmuramoyl-tripeptide--D-alanyl-D-alanine ligase